MADTRNKKGETVTRVAVRAEMIDRSLMSLIKVAEWRPPTRAEWLEENNMSKTQKRAEWIKTRAAEIEAARVPELTDGSRNGARRLDQSGGGWGWWARALALVGIRAEARNYWSGSLPTPSTSINNGIAKYINDNAPEDLK